MAFLDGELERETRDAAQSHLGECARCRARLEELRATAVTVGLALQCLDDEGVAAWVDHEARGMKGALSETDVRRIRNHLTGCGRCRAQVTALRKACGGSESIRERLSTRVRNVLANWRVQPIQTLRWAPAAVVGVVAVAVASVVLTRSGQELHRPEPVGRAVGGPRYHEHREPAATIIAQQDREKAVGTGPVRGGAAKQPEKSEPSVSVAQRPPAGEGRTPLRPEAALFPDEEGTDDGLEVALSDWKRVRASGETKEAARAALKVGGMLHRRERYPEAAYYYREAAQAAGRAAEVQLRVDALVLLGATLAELGKTEEARRELGTAVALAREAGYERGEETARVQMELLPDTEAIRGRQGNEK